MPASRKRPALLIFFSSREDLECALSSEKGLEGHGCFALRQGPEGELLRLAERYAEAFGVRSVALATPYASAEALVKGLVREMAAGRSSVFVRVQDPCGGRLEAEEARIAELIVEMIGIKVNEVEPEVELKAYLHGGVYYAVVWELGGSEGRACPTGTRACVIYDWSEEALRLVYSLISQGASEVYVSLSEADPAGLRRLFKQLWDLRRRSLSTRVYVALGGVPRGVRVLRHGNGRCEVPDEVLRAVKFEHRPIARGGPSIRPSRPVVVEVKGGPVGYHAALDELLKALNSTG